MSVHDELKKAVNRIAQLEQEVRFHESVVTIQMDEKKKVEDMEAVWREANANLEKACDFAITNMKDALAGKQEAEERLAGFIESDESLRKLNVEQANELQDAVRTAQEFRNQVEFINNKYEAEKYKAEERSRTIEALQQRLQIDPGGSDLIDAQESAIEHLRHQLSTAEAKFRIANRQAIAARDEYAKFRVAIMTLADGLRTKPMRSHSDTERMARAAEECVYASLREILALPAPSDGGGAE